MDRPKEKNLVYVYITDPTIPSSIIVQITAYHFRNHRELSDRHFLLPFDEASACLLSHCHVGIECPARGNSSDVNGVSHLVL